MVSPQQLAAQLRGLQAQPSLGVGEHLARGAIQDGWPTEACCCSHGQIFP